MTPLDPDTEELLARAGEGDDRARQQVLVRHRERLKRMVALHLDRRVSARIDPSDVVQEALADAAQKLSAYLRERPLPFYPWLRRLAWERLVKLHQHHLHARKRSAEREEQPVLDLPDDSALELAKRLASSVSSPSKNLLRAELRRRVQAGLALAQLCQLHKKRYAAAVRWYGEAFATQPALAGELPRGNRYNAACAAALTGCGQGEDARTLDDKERAGLRGRGLEWLRADLEVWGNLLTKDPAKGRGAVLAQMQRWQRDADFAGVRHPEAVSRLPEADPVEWQRLWPEVKALRQRAAGGPEHR